MLSSMRLLASRSLLAASLAHVRTRAVRAISISSAFDAGNIELIEQVGERVRLRIRPDPYTELEQKSHMQWFAFRSTMPPGGEATEVEFTIENAGECSFPEAWPGYEVVASHDKRRWHRCKTYYDSAEGALSWRWTHSATPAESTVYFAYYDLYPYERQLDLMARCAAAAEAPNLQVGTLGQTLEGRELDVVTVGSGPLQAWVIHRQHPGESMAAFFAEGLLTRLLGLGSDGVVDGLTSKLLRRFTFHIIPCMNPDGAAHGYLRVNAGGANLNREWASTGDYEAPSLSRSPEVYHTLAAMDMHGVDFFVDVHGDEALPFAFLAGSEGLGVWGARHQALHGAFVAAYTRANTDMQPRFGYAATPPHEGNLAICSNQVGQRFDCLAATLEMPFKDNAANPDAVSGFDGHRCAALGASLLDALAYVEPQLRGVTEPVFALPDDAYVDPVEDQGIIDAHLAALDKACPAEA
jgi:murein tripeptide amidase MpaA